jgi:hypothetical protein
LAALKSRPTAADHPFSDRSGCDGMPFMLQAAAAQFAAYKCLHNAPCNVDRMQVLIVSAFIQADFDYTRRFSISKLLAFVL